MERILITGGGGFVGSHLAGYLRRRRCLVRVADIRFEDHIPSSQIPAGRKGRLWQGTTKASAMTSPLLFGPVTA